MDLQLPWHSHFSLPSYPADTSFPRTEPSRHQLQLMPAFLAKSSLKNRQVLSWKAFAWEAQSLHCIWDFMAYRNEDAQEKATNLYQTCYAFCNLCLIYHWHRLCWDSCWIRTGSPRPGEQDGTGVAIFCCNKGYLGRSCPLTTVWWKMLCKHTSLSQN